MHARCAAPTPRFFFCHEVLLPRPRRSGLRSSCPLWIDVGRVEMAPTHMLKRLKADEIPMIRRDPVDNKARLAAEPIVEAVRTERDARELRVHFMGWNSRWDEWVRVGTGRLKAMPAQ